MKKIIISFLFIFFISPSFASQCMPKDIETSFNEAARVFIGQAQKVEFIKSESLDNNYFGPEKGCGGKVVLFKVENSWKGDLSPVEIYSGDGCVGLGGYFNEGERYLVYAVLRNGRLETSPCYRTRSILNPGPLEPSWDKEAKELTELHTEELKKNLPSITERWREWVSGKSKNKKRPLNPGCIDHHKSKEPCKVCPEACY